MTETKTLTWYNDIVGSFLRPEQIKDAREKVSKGKMKATELRAIEDSEIEKLVRKQVEVGLKSVTDGEFRRSWWHLDFMWGLDGVEKAATASGLNFHCIETANDSASLIVLICFLDHPVLEAFTFLQSIIPDGVMARQTVPSAAQFVYELMKAHNIENTKAIYPNKAEMYDDIVAAYQKAFTAFYE